MFDYHSLNSCMNYQMVIDQVVNAMLLLMYYSTDSTYFITLQNEYHRV